jgi:hypothetical protein
VLDTPQGCAALKQARISSGLVLRVAGQDADHADHHTGRDVATAHETVAELLDVAKITVRRARSVLEALGFAVTVVAGRYLTTAERETAHAHHGGHQLRCASVRALTIPRGCTSYRREHLPRRGWSEPLASRTKCLPSGAQARPGTSAMRKPRPPRSLAVQRLAAKLVQRLPWLARGHIGALCDVLAAHGLDEDGWTAQDVIEHLDARNRGRGLYSIPGSRQRNPLGLFRSQLQDALTTVTEPPQQRRAREARERAVARQAARDAHANAQAEAAAPEAVRRHAAAIRTALRASRPAQAEPGRDSRTCDGSAHPDR